MCGVDLAAASFAAWASGSSPHVWGRCICKGFLIRKQKSGCRNRPEFLIPMSVIAAVRQLAQTGFGCPVTKSCVWTAMRRMTDLTSERFSVDYKFDPLQLRVYLKTPNVTGSEKFLRWARHFFAGILTYFKEKWCSAAWKDPLSGCVGSFQIHPRQAIKQ